MEKKLYISSNMDKDAILYHLFLSAWVRIKIQSKIACMEWHFLLGSTQQISAGRHECPVFRELEGLKIWKQSGEQAILDFIYLWICFLLDTISFKLVLFRVLFWVFFWFFFLNMLESPRCYSVKWNIMHVTFTVLEN